MECYYCRGQENLRCVPGRTAVCRECEYRMCPYCGNQPVFRHRDGTPGPTCGGDGCAYTMDYQYAIQHRHMSLAEYLRRRDADDEAMRRAASGTGEYR